MSQPLKIAVISGKGGSGKSSITAAFVDLSERVVALDCDVDASNLPLLFPHQIVAEEPFVSSQRVVIDDSICVGCGRCAARCAYHALSMTSERTVQVNPLLCEGCGVCQLRCPVQAITMEDVADSRIYTSTFSHGVMIHGALCPGDDNSGKMIARMRTVADEAMEQGKYDLQLLDGPPGIGCSVISTVTGVNKVVIVSEPTLSGISDLRRAYNVASSFCQDIFVVINKSTMNEENRQTILSFCQQNRLPVIAQLPFDRRLVEAQLHCQSMVMFAPDSECTLLLKNAYQQLIAI